MFTNVYKCPVLGHAVLKNGLLAIVLAVDAW